MRIKYTRISQLVTNSGAVRKTGRGVEESDLGVVTNACVILEDGRVSFAGFEADAPDVSVELERDLENKIVMPGFIDAQTRTVHGGDRFHEFALRATGMDDARIDAAGGG
ncbi:hypothetical protein K8I61_11295, partial [bacterium]|nr:hypothetical protein [bacterium]